MAGEGRERWEGRDLEVEYGDFRSEISGFFGRVQGGLGFGIRSQGSKREQGTTAMRE